MTQARGVRGRYSISEWAEAVFGPGASARAVQAERERGQRRELQRQQRAADPLWPFTRLAPDGPELGRAPHNS